jgi:hypothetical protein
VSGQTTEQCAIFWNTDRSAAYAVPQAVLEAHQATVEQREAVLARKDDTNGFNTQVDAPLYLFTEEELESYKLSDEQRAALEAKLPAEMNEDDTEGHQFIGIFPQNVAVQKGSGLATWTGQGYAMVPAWLASSSWFNANADYHPPLR